MVSLKIYLHPHMFPYTHEQAELWFDLFLKERFKDFGPYEDAITSNQHFMLHSALSSSLNMGLLTPNEVINKALSYAKKKIMPLMGVFKNTWK